MLERDALRKPVLPIRCHILVNASAGSTQLGRFAEALRTGLPQLAPILHGPGSVTELRTLVRSLPLEEDVVIAGGDGTLQCVLPDLLESQRPIVILPMGTANDFARHANYSADLLCVYRALSNRVLKKVDVITCNDLYFVTVGGLGVGAFLTRDFNFLRRRSAILKKLSQFAGTNIYTALAAATIVGRRAYLREYEIESNGIQRTGVYSNVFVCNQPRLGGELMVAPNAHSTDGFLDVLLLRGQTPSELLNSLGSLRFRKDPPLSERIRTQKMTIRSRDGRGHLLFADGEAFEMASELSFSVMPGVLNLLTAGDTIL